MKNLIARTALATSALVLLFMAPDLATGEAPEVISHQGLLARADGTIVPNGLYGLRFRICSSAVGENCTWAQSLSVSVQNGVYNVLLSGAGLAAQFSQSVAYLDIRIESAPAGFGSTVPLDMQPRQQISSVPYALSAASAEVAETAATAQTAVSLSTANSCYDHWGDTTCASGFTPVVVGHMGGVENWSSNGGRSSSAPMCVSDAAPVREPLTSGYYNRLVRAGPSNEALEVDSTCATCCAGGCYVALGSAQCEVGWNPVYSGTVGGIEAFTGGGGLGIRGATVCVDSSSPTTFNYGTTVLTRLMRFRAPNPAGNHDNGMESVDPICTVCCR